MLRLKDNVVGIYLQTVMSWVSTMGFYKWSCGFLQKFTRVSTKGYEGFYKRLRGFLQKVMWVSTKG